jgi:glucan phosphorylase
MTPAAEYKRADLLFSDLNRLRAIHENAGPFQVDFGGKAHPTESGKNNHSKGGRGGCCSA